MRKQAKLMGFGLNYQHFADYQDKASVVEISYSNVPHLSNYRASVTFFRAEFERHSSTRRRRSGVERRETVGE